MLFLIVLPDPRNEKRGSCKRSHRVLKFQKPNALDNVDFGRQVRRNFEADFLFANGGLGPGLHDVSSRV